MTFRCTLLALVVAAAALRVAAAQGPQKAGNPTDNLPPHVTQVTAFGERADWSHDGRRLLFLSKTFGDAMEIDVSSGRIRNLTAHFPHHGYTRALYLANGDVLLSGPHEFDVRRPEESRVQCWLSVLAASGDKPPTPLGVKCSEGPAVSRSGMHLAWTQVAAQYPDEMPEGSSRIYEADLVADGSGVRLGEARLVLDSRDLKFRCTLESQNFRPPAEQELIFSAYDYQGTDVCGVDLAAKKVINYSDAPNQYDEPEGIFPDGRFTLVECDAQNRQGPGHVDLWKLTLDGSRNAERLTYFSDFAGYKASNGVVSDDGRRVAFQLAKASEAAGVGHGIFVLDLAAIPKGD